jgi:hypothetical protein
MEPPICALCGRDQRDEPELAFDLVSFREHETLDFPGHPDGVLWFCQEHVEDARNLDFLLADEALRRLRKNEQRPGWLKALRRMTGLSL